MGFKIKLILNKSIPNGHYEHHLTNYLIAKEVNYSPEKFIKLVFDDGDVIFNYLKGGKFGKDERDCKVYQQKLDSKTDDFYFVKKIIIDGKDFITFSDDSYETIEN